MSGPKSASYKMIKHKLLAKLIDELNGIVPETDHFNIYELRGFFYAIAITPPSILPEQWENCLFYHRSPDFELKHIENLMSAAFDVYDAYVHLRVSGQLKFPFDIEKLRGKQFDWVQQWCIGFWTGLALCREFWLGDDGDTANVDAYWDDVARNASLFEVLMTHDFSKFPNIEQIKANFIEEGIEPTDDCLLARLFVMIPSSVENLQHVIDDIEAELEEQKTLGQATSKPKIGRNAPCPCGSGKKFKNCCLS
ncbi:hypothetical protein EQU24_11055 [Methylotuvimicrobium buryatense]|uniref:YecA family protein n=2 Tax=Methylotuvimicrobium buryatense TaxID=95641 RepID=A0A4P9USK8_METBY|nr:hypothetical protein EQU24_11055 [Methylotuvimicrobium buryatense]